jgi:hypothetical protein
MLDWYRRLIELRRVRLIASDAQGVETNAWYDSTRTLLAYSHADLLVCCNLGSEPVRVPEAMGAMLVMASDGALRSDAGPVLNPDSVAIWSNAADVGTELVDRLA